MNGLFSIQRKIPKISVGTEHFELVQFDRNIWDHGRARGFGNHVSPLPNLHMSVWALDS